jgi:hypothetical protein
MRFSKILALAVLLLIVVWASDVSASCGSGGCGRAPVRRALSAVNHARPHLIGRLFHRCR